MKKLSLQWRITLMTVLLIGATCVFMNVLIGYSGRHYMDSIGSYITGYGDTDRGEPEYFDPEQKKLDEELTIVVHGAQESFITTNWYITAAVTVFGGALAYFLSGRALKPLRTFTSQVEKVQLNNLTDMKINEDVLPEFRQFSRSFNQMLERLDEGFTAQRQFTGNAAHELRTPLSLMQAQLELFSAEHPEVLPETADFLRLLREQTERMTQMTKTLLEMSELKTVPCTDRIELAPMAEEILADLAPLADRNGIILESEGNGVMIGSDTLIYRMLFNLTENSIRYNRQNGMVRILITDKKISNMQEILPLLEKIVSANQKLLIISDEIENEALAMIVLNKLRGTFTCVAVKAPSFGDNRKEMLEDIAILTGGTFVSEELGQDLKQVTLEMLGRAKSVKVDKDNTTIVEGMGDKEEIKKFFNKEEI